MDLEMRSSWIIQLGPNSNAKCPYKTHTGDRHTGRRHVKTKTETGMMWPQTTSLCDWRIILYSNWKLSELRNQENQGGRHMIAPDTWQQIKNENNNADHLVTNSWSLMVCCLDIECLVSVDFTKGFLGTHSENAMVSGNQYSVIHSTNIQSSVSGAGITAKYKTHKGGHSKWTTLCQAVVSAMKKNKAGRGCYFIQVFDPLLWMT